MKNRILKALASFGLSVCVLAGSSVVSIAEETPGKTECKEHTWKTTTEYKTECVETTFQHKLPDGTTETLTLCPECGKVKNNTQLTKVNGVFSNFSNLTIHTGPLQPLPPGVPLHGAAGGQGLPRQHHPPLLHRPSVRPSLSKYQPQQRAALLRELSFAVFCVSSPCLAD